MSERGNVLVVDDDDVYRMVLSSELGRRGFRVRNADCVATAVTRMTEEAPDVALVDLRLPDGDGLAVLRAATGRAAGIEVILLTGHGSIDTAIEAMKLGAFDYVAKPCPIDEIEIRVRKALERRAMVQRTALLESGLAMRGKASDFVGCSEWHTATLERIERFAPTDASVLILGETGTGKEVLARLIHAQSLRASRPWVVVDCTALHEDLLLSELFGHEKGAYTGAVGARAGLFEVADGGTIFLDEVGDMSPSTQVRLLRVLESSTFRRVGGSREIRVDVRVIAATNRDLHALIAQGHFRADLFYRLATLRLDLAPLRERPADVPVLARHFAERFGARFGRQVAFAPEAMAALERYAWPGNVRELLHVVEQALIVGDGPRVELAHMPPHLTRTARGATATQGTADGPQASLEQLGRAHIERVLASVGGHRGKAAHILGISERSLYRKLRELA